MHNYGHWKKTLALLVMSALSLGASSVDAMPEGGVIRSGEGAVSQNGREMTIRQDSGRLAMDWTNFNVGKDETVRFQQPGKEALALNRVTGNQQSLIDGSLLSNGHVLLVNPNGVVIGKNATIDVGGLVASTAHVKDNFMKEFGNSTGAFTLGGVSDGKIINEGTINAEGGLVALHAAKVENSGTIKSNGGSVLIAAADTLTLTPDTDGKLNFTVDGKVAEAGALNKGAITADGGTIVMTADSASDVMSTVVNNEGTLQARTLRKNEKGQILLEGNDKGQVEVSGTLDASGTDDGQDAGNIKVIGQKTIVHDGTNLLAKGDVNGGKIETSGDVLDLGDNLNIDAKGVNGKAGEWLLDPLAVYINDDDKDPTAGLDSGTDKKTLDKSDITSDTKVLYNDPNKDGSNGANADSASVGVTWIKGSFVNEMLTNGTDVKIQAASTNGAASIILNSVINPTVGGSKKEATFTLEANRNIEIHKDIKANSEGGKLNVVLNANTNNDGIGAVIIDADIETNGGYFISASGGKGEKGVRLESNGSYGFVTGNLTGEADHGAGTVGTHFGNTNTSGESGEKGDRWIITNGGAVTLNGEVSIGLNGGSLIIDTTARDGKSDGKVTVTGIVNSGNAYTLYTENSDKLNKLFESLAEITDENDPLYKYTPQYYLSKGLVPAYHFEGVNYEREMEADGVTPKKVNGQYVYVKDKDGNYKYTTEAYTFGKDEKHYAFHELKSGDTASAGWTYVDTEPSIDTQNVQWYISGKAGTGYRAFIMTEGTMSFQQYLYFLQKSQKQFSTNYPKGTNPENYSDAEKLAIIKELMINNWFVAEKLAQGETNGGAEVGDTYLATLTTRLENSLNAPDYQMPLYIGGRGSGIRDKNNDLNNNPYQNMPVDPTHQSGFYWVTGPEGQGNGTLFYDMRDSKFQASTVDGKKSDVKGKEVYGYTNWSSYENAKGTAIFWQPDNSSPFLTVGYGRTSLWDDAAIDGATTVGFIQEKNLANSSLNIKAGSGDVKLQGDIGKAKALDTVNIESKGAVTVGTDNNNVTDYYHGTIYADHGVYISGGTVSVGGEIHSGTTDTTASASDIKTRTDGYQNEAFQLDNVTIKSAGDLTVHGVESDGYMGSDDTLNGGKISLTSTGDFGKITLGAGVDYDGKATAGTLAAASTEKGAVVIDAQGSQGSLVNSTDPKSSAITTGTDGTWQVYVNSPSDYGTSLGSNLISGTNAQWTAKSTANTTVTTNSSSNTLEPYTDTSSNKFIFQVTPVITISGGYASKTYGDKLSEETMEKTLTSKAIYKDSNGNDIDVTKYDNFVESKYLDYVTSSDGTKKGLSTVNISSAGAKETATRTNGNEKVKGSEDYKTASDKNRAFYVMDVAYQDGVKALNGYDKAANNGEVEIIRKTLTISTDGTQTYGKTAVTKGKPSYDKTQLVNGDTLGDIQYTIATDGSYAASKGSNDTAHVGKYEDQYLTSSAKVKASDDSDASANYEVTGSGTITVTPDDLYLTVGDVSTTYGTAFNTDKYTYTIDTAKGGLVNGDIQDAVLGEKFLNYTNTGAKTDASNENVKTQNAGSYVLQGSASKELSDYTVHITDGKSTVNKAKLTLTVGDTEATYGSDAWTPYTYTLQGNTNGDTVDGVKNKQISVTYTNGGEKSVASNKDVKTQDVGSYDLTGEFTLSGDTAVNYEIDKVNSKLTGTAKVNQAEIHLKLNDVSTTYGTPFETSKYGYDASQLKMANGDSTDVVTKAITNGDITYTNTGTKTDPNNNEVLTQNAGDGYILTGTTEKTLKNYIITIDGAKSSIDKATLKLKVGDYTEAYGDAKAVQKDLNKATTVSGEKNGDSLTELTEKIGIKNTSSALLSAYRTNDVKYKTDGSLDSYDITTSFNKSLDNYTVVLDKTGSIKLTPIAIKVTNEMVQTYGSTDKTFKEVSMPSLVNGDTISKDGLTMKPKAGGAYETNRAGRTTADAGTYYNDLESDGGGIVHENGNDARKNYSVTIEGDIIVKPKNITTRANGTGSTLDNLSWDVQNDSLVNGDVWGKDVLFDKTYGDMISYADKTFGVKSFINGQPISDGTQIGNYIYHPKGIVQLTFNPIVKPDVWAHSGGYRPRNKIETSLPVFRVEDAKVGQYGTYGVEHREGEDKLVLSATGMRLPEPDQVPDEERTFTTTLSTEEGSGTFKLEYNGVSLKVHPQDKKAEEVVRAGDKTKNVSLSEKALYVGYTEMGLDLIDLKGVYIYFN